jgi:hypothetical protein
MRYANLNDRAVQRLTSGSQRGFHIGEQFRRSLRGSVKSLWLSRLSKSRSFNRVQKCLCEFSKLKEFYLTFKSFMTDGSPHSLRRVEAAIHFANHHLDTRGLPTTVRVGDKSEMWCWKAPKGETLKWIDWSRKWKEVICFAKYSGSSHLIAHNPSTTEIHRVQTSSPCQSKFRIWYRCFILPKWCCLTSRSFLLHYTQQTTFWKSVAGSN